MFITALAIIGIAISEIIGAVRLAAGNGNITLLLSASVLASEVPTTTRAAASFTRGLATAKKFGMHEIRMTGSGTVSNPFDTIATVTFVPPSGNAVTVFAFYDGGKIWRARIYVSEIGKWQWTCASPDDPGLQNESGSFMAVNSDLPGMLRKHPRNPKQWMTDNGRAFINLSDTAYSFFNSEETRWREYVRDNAALGITSMRVDSLRAPSAWENYWEDGTKARYKLENFKVMDTRLQWLLDNYPNMYIQLKLFREPTIYGTDDPFWSNLPQTVRANTMRYMIARWAAYPNLFFEVTADTRCSPAYPHNQAMARDVGQYFKENDPWKHLMSFGPTRDEVFCFTAPQDDWVSYIALETAAALSADDVEAYADLPLHVFNEEDFYEPLKELANPRYFYRRLFWSWLLSGGSSTYGGRYGVIHPYTQTGSLIWKVDRQTISGQLVGLDSIRYIIPYFHSRGIELWRFQPDDRIVSDVTGESELKSYLTNWFFGAIKRTAFGSARPKASRRGNEEYLIYHPNAKAGEISGSAMEETRLRADLDSNKTARIRVDLGESRGTTFSVEWFRPHDGIVQDDDPVEAGAYRDFIAPWKGYDVILRLVSVESNLR